MPTEKQLKNLEKGKPFTKGDPRINRAGRPRKVVLMLKKEGYTSQEISDTITSLLAMTTDELSTIAKDPDADILIKTIILTLNKAVQKGSIQELLQLISRAVGNPVQPVAGDISGIDVFVKGIKAKKDEE